MSHVSPGLVAEAGGNQLVVAPHRAIEEDQRRAGEPGFQLIGDVSAGGKKIEIFSRRLVADPKPERVACAIISAGVSLAFQIPRAFAGDGERLDLDAGWRAVGQCRLACPVRLYSPAAPLLLVQHV